MVSKASDDLPEPDRPVRTTSRSRGISTSTFLRLCSRAPDRDDPCVGPAALVEKVVHLGFFSLDLRQIRRTIADCQPTEVAAVRPICGQPSFGHEPGAPNQTFAW